MKKAAPKAPPPSVPSSFLSGFQSYQPLNSIIHYYVDLSTFLVTDGSEGGWWILNRRKRELSLYELETEYGHLGEREQAMDSCFRRARKAGGTLCGEYLGFKDLFVPLRRGGEIAGFLQSGSFATEPVTEKTVAECWRKLTGRKVFSPLPEFQRFVRVLLSIPVLEGPLFPAFREALELYAGLLADGEKPEEVGRRLRRLLMDVFSKRLPHSYFLNWALGLPTREPIPAWGKHVGDWGWIREEIGITRVPTTVIAVAPRQRGLPGSSWLGKTLKVQQLQKKGFLFAKGLPETVGGKLEDYGLVFLTSTPTGLTRSQRVRALEQIAGKIRAFAQAEVGAAVQIGIGQMVRPGELLHESYRQALVALHLARHSDKEILFYEEGQSPAGEVPSSDELTARLQELSEAFRSDGPAPMEAARDGYVEAVLRQGVRDPESLRTHFHYAFLHVVEAARESRGKTTKEIQTLIAEWEGDLERAATTQDLVLAFRTHLDRVTHFLLKPRSLESAIGMEKAKRYLDANFHQTPQATELARMAGVAPEVFSRKFRLLTGVGFSRYAQELRIGKARQLLTSGLLPISRIAGLCGFKSVPTFIHTFKRATGFKPSRYRQNHR